MKTIVTLLSILVLLTTISSCKKSTNAVIYVQLKTSYSNSVIDLSGISISIQKQRTKNDFKFLRPSLIRPYKVVSKFEGVTDKNGFVRIPVNNRGWNHWFKVEAIPKLNKYGQKSFRSNPEKVNKDQVNETLILRIH